MSPSFIYLRRALFGTSCLIVFGFGATTALAGSGPSPAATAVPVPQFIHFYSTPNHAEMVGLGRWTCQGTYVQQWGIATQYSESVLTVCRA